MSDRIERVSENVKMKRDERFIPPLELLNCGHVTLSEWQVSRRALPLWHVYWNSGPGGKLIVKERVIPMMPDKVYLLPPFLMFATAADRVFEHCYIDFSLRSELFSRVRKEPIVFPAAMCENMLKRCFDEKFSALAGAALILFLLDAIPQEYFAQKATCTIDLRIQHALEVISEAFHAGRIKELNNHAICRKIGMSYVNFQHLFKREMKISPHRYILNLRLENAHDLLKNSSRSIKDIAEAAGFVNRYQFTKSFAQVFGEPPGKVRER